MGDMFKIGDRVRLTNEARQDRSPTLKGDVTRCWGNVLMLDGQWCRVHWDFLNEGDTWHEHSTSLTKYKQSQIAQEASMEAVAS